MDWNIKQTRPFAVALSALLAGALSGCGKPIKAKPATTQANAEAKDDRVADTIREDPVAYLETCLDRCRKIDEFTCTFWRQERLGIVPELRPLERIFAKWRRDPLAIKFDLPDETSEYAQSLYDVRKHEDKVLVLPRKGLLGLPPTVGTFPISWSILFHKAKNRITDFGPERMLERTLNKIQYTKDKGISGQTIAYKGIVKLKRTGQDVHLIQIDNPKHPDYPHGKQHLYIDTKLQIPAGVRLWNQKGELDSMYLYVDMKLNPGLTDEDFKIIPPKKSQKKAEATSRPAPKG